MRRTAVARLWHIRRVAAVMAFGDLELDNPATRLYRDLGWVVVAEADGAATMVLELADGS